MKDYRPTVPRVNFHMVYCVVLLAVVSIFAALLYKSDKPGTLKLKLGDNHIEMAIDDELSVEKIIEYASSNDSVASSKFRALLKEFGDYYHPTDPGIVAAIERQSKESAVSERLRMLLRSLSGPFDRSTHNFYYIEDVELVAAIEKLDYDHAVSKQLRDLSYFDKGPFEPREVEIFVSAHDGNIVSRGRAASCRQDLYNRVLRVFNADKTRSVQVTVSERIPCGNDGNDGNVEISSKPVRISYDDMKNLIGNPALGKKERASALVIRK